MPFMMNLYVKDHRFRLIWLLHKGTRVVTPSTRSFVNLNVIHLIIIFVISPKGPPYFAR
jgi:hypothetical protein